MRSPLLSAILCTEGLQYATVKATNFHLSRFMEKLSDLRSGSYLALNDNNVLIELFKRLKILTIRAILMQEAC